MQPLGGATTAVMVQLSLKLEAGPAQFTASVQTNQTYLAWSPGVMLSVTLRHDGKLHI